MVLVDGTYTKTEYPIHDCTDEDWALFHPNEIETTNYINTRAAAYDSDPSDVLATFKCIELD